MQLSNQDYQGVISLSPPMDNNRSQY